MISKYYIMDLPKPINLHEESFHNEQIPEEHELAEPQQALKSFKQKAYRLICLLLIVLAALAIFIPSHEQREFIGTDESPTELSDKPTEQSVIAGSKAVIALEKARLQGLCIAEPNVNASISTLEENDRLGGHVRKHVDCYEPKSKKQVTSCFLGWGQFKSIFNSFSEDMCLPSEVDVRNNVMREHKLPATQWGYIKRYRAGEAHCQFQSVKVVYKLVELTPEKYYWIVLTSYPSDCQ